LLELVCPGIKRFNAPPGSRRAAPSSVKRQRAGLTGISGNDCVNRA
jgi:hypothetical protein